MLLRDQIRRAFSRAAHGYEQVAVLQAKVGDLLLERLELLATPPQRVLDVGCGSGRLDRLLRKRLPKAELIALDVALGMLREARRQRGYWRPIRHLAGDACALPLADASVDLLVSNLCLQWVEDLDRALVEFRRVLRPGGWLLLSSFGPDTLHELREAWRAADDREHVHRFVPIQQLGDRMLALGWVDPVLDSERYTLLYDDARQLMRELKAIGAGNALHDRRRGLTGKSGLQRMLAAYESRRRDGRLPASYEVLFAQARAPGAGQALPLAEGGAEARFSLQAMRERLRRR